MYSGRDFWWDKFLEGQSEQNNAVEVDAEDLLFILYTSGSTGKPKGGCSFHCRIYDLHILFIYQCISISGK